MTTFLIIVLLVLMGLTVFSLVRGVVAFLKSTRTDLETGGGDNASEMQLLQSKMMMNRIKYQALAIVVVMVMLAMAR
jgi:hypothetical protein